MSLGSKELFHSNVIGWIAESIGPANLLGAWMTPDKSMVSGPSVLRERLNLDLILQNPGYRPLVIENKAFALPDRVQLDRYSPEVLTLIDDERDSTAVLLSLIAPAWHGTHVAKVGERSVTWDVKTYRELGSLIERSASMLSGYAGQTMQEYARYAVDLQQLCDVIGRHAEQEPVDFPASVRQILQRARFDALAQKVRASAVAGAISARLPSPNFNVNSGFTRGRAMVELFERRPSLEPGLRRGIQYQNGQIRLAAIMGALAGRSDDDRKRREHRANAMLTAGEWFEFDVIDRILGARAKAQRDATRWLRYDPDFVYRYRTAQDVTSQELVSIMLAYAERLHLVAV
jgi:hypothetical protein